jgi:phospholipid/cholesterol/gamma-HCH transport system substrate-binding protein
VKYNGVDVGTVRDIQLDPVDPARVRLTFAIREGTPIKTDTEAVLKTQGLTGITYVELEGGSPDAPLLRAATSGALPEIRTKPSLSARLENVLTTVLVKLDATTTRLDAVLSDQNVRAFSETLRDIAEVSHMLAARRATLESGIDGAARTFQETQRLGQQLGPVVERIGRAADSLEKLGREAGLASTQIGATVASVGGDVQRVSSRTMPEVRSLMDELKVLAVSLRQLVQKTERNPAGLFLGRSPVADGPGEAPTAASPP